MLFIYSNEFIHSLMFDKNRVYQNIISQEGIKIQFVYINYNELCDDIYWRRLKKSGLKYVVENNRVFRKHLKEFITETSEGLNVDYTYDDLDWFYMPFFTHTLPNEVLEMMGEKSSKAEKNSNKKKKSKYTAEERAEIEKKKAERRQERKDDRRIDSIMVKYNIDINIDNSIRSILRRGIRNIPVYIENKHADIRFISIDIGVKNFCTVCSNVFTPYLISGHTMTSALGHYEQYYNHVDYGRYATTKKYSNSRKQKRLEKRNDILHEFIVNVCDRIMKSINDYNIDTVICGYPEIWSKKTGFESKDVNIMFQRSFANFKEMLKKRCKKHNIKFVEIDEAFTSVCSFVDNEDICNKKEHLGKRVTRDKYFSKQGYSLNADVNASYNIAKKYLVKTGDWSDKYFTQMVAMLNNSRFIYELKQGYDKAVKDEEHKKEKNKAGVINFARVRR